MMKRPFLDVLLLLTLVGPRFAGAQSILITEPTEWRERQAIVVVAGRPVRIAGSVSHPAGVAKLLINGREVEIRQDKAFPDYYEFEKIIPADSMTAEVIIRIVPVSGQPFEKPYAARLPAPVVSPTRRVADPAPPPLPRRSDWGSFKRHSILYGGAMIGGGVLLTMNKTESAVICSSTTHGSDCVNRTTTSKPYQAVGGGLLGGAAFVAIIDAFLTSRRAGQAVASLAVPGGMRVSVDVPALAPSPRGATLQVLRIGVH